MNILKLLEAILAYNKDVALLGTNVINNFQSPFRSLLVFSFILTLGLFLSHYLAIPNEKI